MGSFSLLARGSDPEPSDAIFAFAGHDARKRFALELFREGYAPRVILSVARFEWRRFAKLGLEDDGGLEEQVAAVEPTKRHFFVIVSETGTGCESVAKGRLGTLAEARALAALATRLELGSILIVSSSSHLPRCRLALRAYLPRECRVVPVATPEKGESGGLFELVKLGAYGAFTAPRQLVRRASNR